MHATPQHAQALIHHTIATTHSFLPCHLKQLFRSSCCFPIIRASLCYPFHPYDHVQGSDQIRQAFSKRKKGLVLKSYQLFRLTDAKVCPCRCRLCRGEKGVLACPRGPQALHGPWQGHQQ